MTSRGVSNQKLGSSSEFEEAEIGEIDFRQVERRRRGNGSLWDRREATWKLVQAREKGRSRNWRARTEMRLSTSGELKEEGGRDPLATAERFSGYQSGVTSPTLRSTLTMLFPTIRQRYGAYYFRYSIFKVSKIIDSTVKIILSENCGEMIMEDAIKLNIHIFNYLWLL